MAKKITAPKTYDPGRGRPKEHLAYLNQREMDYLRSINGNNMERGPRGLPSFPPDDAIGSSSRSTSSGNKTGVGGGGGGGGGSTGSRGSSTGSVGSRSGSEAPGNLGGGGKGGSSPSGPAAGAGGQRGAGSNYGPGSARPGTPSSPMGGQNPSFSSPSAASNYNRDQVAQQRAAIKDAVGVVRSNSALKGDLQVGGIRSISVGPIGTTVSVPKALTSAVSGAVNPAKTGISQSLKYSSPIGPAYGPDNIAELNRQEQELRGFLSSDYPDVVRTGDPISAGGIPTNPPTAPSGFSNLPEPRIPGRVDVNDGLDPFGQFQNKNVTDIGKVPTGPSYGKLGSYSGYSFDPSSTAQREAIDRGLSESVINAALSSEVPQSTPTTSTNPNNRVPPEGVEVVGGLGHMGTYAPDAPISMSASGLTTRQIDSLYGTPRSPGKTRGLEPSQDVPEAAPPQSMNPMQGDWGDIQREKGFIEKYGKYVPNALVRGIVKGYGYVEDKKWANMSPEERLAQLSRGVRPTGTPTGMGTDNDRGPYSRAEPYDPRESTRGRKRIGQPTVPESSGPRPQQYFNWDVGVGIPSPTDSDYTLYLKYLQEKAAARAALS